MSFNIRINLIKMRNQQSEQEQSEEDSLQTKLKNIFFYFVSFVLTFYISVYYVFTYVITLILRPDFIPSAFLKQLSCHKQYCKHSRNKKIKVYRLIQIVLNSMISLISVIMIANYSGFMIYLVEIISHQAHRQFISLIYKDFPQISTYMPYNLVSYLYVLIGYFGVTTQLALTLDFICFFNISTIFIYKILAFAYKYCLLATKWCLRTIRHQPQRWISCKTKQLWIKQNWQWLHLTALGALVVLVQILLIVAFYYLWLSIVIISLLILMNTIKNMTALINCTSGIIFLIKNYKQDIFAHSPKSVAQTKNKGKVRFVIKFLKQETLFVSFIKMQSIKDILIGKDIVKFFVYKKPSNVDQQGYFSAFQIYRAFLNLKNSKK